MSAIVQGTGMTPQELARKMNVSVGGMAYEAEEWEPQESYATRLRRVQEELEAHEAWQASLCTGRTKKGYECDRRKLPGEEFCAMHLPAKDV